MIGVRRSDERGRFDHTKSRHFYTFQYGDYVAPTHRGFGPLKVLNEDRLGPGAGFPDHPHEEIELVTFVVSGTLRYKDNLGTSLLLESGDFQRATCGTGIEHAVYNHSDEANLVVLQCHFQPRQAGLEPCVDHWERPDAERRNKWALVACPEAGDGSMLIHQDVRIQTARLDGGAKLEYMLRPGHHAWMQVTQGSVEVNGQVASAGDGVAASDEEGLWLEAQDPCEVLLFDFS